MKNERSKSVWVVTFAGHPIAVCSTQRKATGLITRKERKHYSVYKAKIDEIFNRKPKGYNFYLVKVRYTGNLLEAHELSPTYWSSEFWKGFDKYVEFRIWDVSRNAAIARAKEKFRYLANRKDGDPDDWSDKRGVAGQRPEIIQAFYVD